MMRKNLFLVPLLCIGLFCGCSKSDYYEVSYKKVEATCTTEGYIEHTMNNGYVYRDNITPYAPHTYKSIEIGGEEGISYNICNVCGHLEYNFVDVEVNTDVVIDYNREKPVFTGHKHMAVSMIIETTPDNAIIAMRKAEANGAHGFMIYLTALNPEYWNLQDLERIMYCTNKPVLVIAYNGTFAGNTVSQSAQDFANLLKLGVQAGASAVDMPGYLFCNNYNTLVSENGTYKQQYIDDGYDMTFLNANPKEIALNPQTIAYQQNLVKEIRDLGAEVLYSAHVGVEMTAEETISAAKFIEEAIGVDVVKLVLSGSSKETVIEHLKACMILERELGIKFSVHGQSTLSRLMCPMFGGYIAFCVNEYTSAETNLQIDLATMIAILESPEFSGNS